MPQDRGVSLGSIAIGLALMALGVAAMLALLFGTAESSMLVGPIVFALGVVCCARGCWPRARLWAQNPVLFMGLVLLLIGGCPWLYTPYLVGDRPGGEASGMLGTILFIFAGMPGLVLVVVGAALWLMRQMTGGTSPR